MVTEAVIINIDYNSNKCTVRVPLFETVNTIYPVITEAVFAITPGCFNGYKIDDIVWVAFERNKADLPVIIGKVYKSPTDENDNQGGHINATSIKATEAASLPSTTVITTDDSDFNSLQKVINRIKSIEISANPMYDTILKIKPDELIDDTTIILHLDTHTIYNKSTLENLKKNIYEAGYRSADKYKVVNSNESAIEGLFVTKTDEEYKLYYITSYAGSISPGTGYLVQDWNQQTGIMRLTSQIVTILDVEPNTAYWLPDDTILSIDSLEVSDI